jgi:outer membrane murein-binding lipoprotein Lpp
MNKVLHVLVYVFLALAGAALYFELQLNAKRSLLTDRNRLQEDYLIKIAKTVEKAEPAKDSSIEIRKDASPVEARLVDSPDMENVLDEYPGALEQANLETYSWDNQDVRKQLRQVYVLDFDGKPVMDGNQPLMRGKGTEDELLSKLFESCKAQQSRLNSTRAALVDLRTKLEGAVGEINRLKPEARQDKVTIEEQKEKLSKLEGEKAELENQITKVKSQIDELNGEITSLKDEVSTAKDETEAAKEETAKAHKLIEQLKKLLQESIQTRGSASAGSGTAVTSLPLGDKGKIIEADNENMFAIVEFSDAAMKELKGENLDKPMPAMELGVKRPGYKGVAGEFVGRIRLRQEVKGKNYVVRDILGAWEQDKMKSSDVVYAD